jgi:predicted alpha/beta-fold hydrolase
VTGDKHEFSRLAKKILNEDLSSGVVSYNRKFRNFNTISSGTISLERKYQTNFSITGCRYLLNEVINYVYTTFKKKIILVGFSAGTSLIATYLGCPQTQNKEKIDYAILISAGFHYKESMHKMSRIYKVLCFLNLYIYFRTFHVKYKHNDILDLAFNFAKFNVFNYVISQYKYSLFKSEDEYFRHHDPKYYLPNIKHKVYFLNSLDDFCFPGETIIPLINIYTKKDNFYFHILPTGGHICFKNNSKECGIFEFIKTLSN